MVVVVVVLMLVVWMGGNNIYVCEEHPPPHPTNRLVWQIRHHEQALRTQQGFGYGQR